MADTATITVQEVLIETKQRKDGTGEFQTLLIKGNDGQEFTGYLNDKTILPAEGELVNIDFQSIKGQNKTYNKIITINGGEIKNKSLPWNSDSSKPTQKKVQTPRAKTANAELVQQTVPYTKSFSQTSSKDVSMEVSGLLQALISTGNYNTVAEDGKKYLALGLLENHLKLALGLKRQVASQLEQNGTLE